MAKRAGSRPASKSIKKPAEKPAQIESVGFDQMSPGEKVAWVCLHALIFLVPIAISNLTALGIGGGLPLTFDQFDIIKLFTMRMFTVIGLAGWLISLLMRGGRVRLTKADWLILGFLAWVGLTTITSIHWPTALFGKYRRFEGFISFVNYAAIFFLVVQLVDRAARMRSLLRTLFFSGMIVTLYGVLQYLGIEPVGYGKLPFEANRSFSTYGNPDLLGGFLMFSLPLSFALALSEQRVAWRTVYWIGAVLSSVVVITAFTRSAWIGAFVAMAVLLVAAIRQRVKIKTEDWVMAGVAAGLAALVIVRSMNAPSEVMNFFARVSSIFKFSEGSALTRFQIWSAAIDAIKDRPIFGFGADTFRLVFPRYKPAAYVAAAGYLSVADNVHNYPLQLASAIGIPGFLLLYGIFGWVLWLSAKAAFTAEAGDGNRILYSGVWAAAAGYIVHLFFGLSVTGTTVFLWVMFGLLLAPTARSIEVRPASSAVGILSSLVVGLVALALFWGNFVYISADHQYLLARVAPFGPEARVASAKEAVRRNPFNDIYRAEVGLALTDQAYARLGGQDGGDPNTAADEGQALLRAAEASFLETIAFVPPEYDNYVFLANLYNTMGQQLQDGAFYEKAIAIARKGIAVEEFGPAVRLEYARALYALGRNEEALEQLEFSLNLDPAFGNAALLAADIYQSMGEPEKALVLLRAAEAVKPGQQGIAETIQSLESSVASQ